MSSISLNDKFRRLNSVNLEIMAKMSLVNRLSPRNSSRRAVARGGVGGGLGCALTGIGDKLLALLIGAGDGSGEASGEEGMGIYGAGNVSSKLLDALIVTKL